MADLHAAGQDQAQLYLDDPDDGIGGGGAFFLLLDEPEVYGLPPDPVVTTRDLPASGSTSGSPRPGWPPPASRWASAGGSEGRMTQTQNGQPAASRPGRQPGAGAEQLMVPDAEFTSYYGRPVIKEPVWKAPDVPGYLFFGGLAGASSVLAAGAQLSGYRRAGPGRQDRRARRDQPVRRRPGP